MRLIPTLAAAAALAAATLPVATASAAGDGNELRVFFPGDCIDNVYKPKAITVACADGNFAVEKIKWTTYKPEGARGTGTAVVNLCEPTCVAGKYRRYPARVRLTRVRQCGDVPQFTRLVVTFTGQRPKGMDRVERQSYQCADAPTR